MRIWNNWVYAVKWADIWSDFGNPSIVIRRIIIKMPIFDQHYYYILLMLINKKKDVEMKINSNIKCGLFPWKENVLKSVCTFLFSFDNLNMYLTVRSVKKSTCIQFYIFFEWDSFFSSILVKKKLNDRIIKKYTCFLSFYIRIAHSGALANFMVALIFGTMMMTSRLNNLNKIK